jgi:hypothetical protein
MGVVNNRQTDEPVPDRQAEHVIFRVDHEFGTVPDPNANEIGEGMTQGRMDAIAQVGEGAVEGFTRSMEDAGVAREVRSIVDEVMGRPTGVNFDMDGTTATPLSDETRSEGHPF